MRKHYLDNLRTLMILFLFPVHTFMIWNNFGAKFYVWGGANKWLSSLIIFVNPWFMALLFVIAGMSARYSLEKRGKNFIKERFYKLLFPFISGVIFLIPVQTFYARKFFFGYHGTFLENYSYFFTHFTDLSGYDGAFTPGHLWFLLFLFVITVLSLFVIKKFPYQQVKKKTDTVSFGFLLFLFVPVWIMYYIGNFGGYSLGKYFILYLFGFYLFSNDSVMDTLVHQKKIVFSLFLFLQIALVIAYYYTCFYHDFVVHIVCWLGVLACLVFGKVYLDKEHVLSKYFRTISFYMYYLHQSILVVIGYYSLVYLNSLVLQVIFILLGSFVATLICCEILKRCRFIRKILGFH